LNRPSLKSSPRILLRSATSYGGKHRRILTVFHRPRIESKFTFLPFSSLQESSGTTLMDLISADPTPVPAQSTSSSASSTASQPTSASASSSSHLHHPMSTKTTLGEKKSKRATLMQIQNDTISVAKAALNPVKANIMPQRQRQKKKVRSTN